MQSARLQISSEELSDFVENQGDDNYQHVQKVMNAWGKHPIVPAFQTISTIGNSEIPDTLQRAGYFSVEAFFSSIICPEEKIEFRRVENNGRIAFVWENPDKYFQRFDFKSFVEIIFCFNGGYQSPATYRPYSRKHPVTHDKLQSFSEIIGSGRHNHLTTMFYIASCATSIIVQGFKNPRNTFEDRIVRLKNRNESTPFYRSIKLNFNKRADVIPRDILYEFNGRIQPPRTVFVDFRAMNRTAELLNGILKLDFIAKPNVLKFTKDLTNSNITSRS